MAVAMIALAGLQLASGYFAAQNIRDTAQLNREIDDMNAEFALLDAYDAEIEGHTQKAKYQKTVDQTLAQQQAILTASDVDVSYGSVSTIRKETEFVAELNKVEIEKRAQEQALGYERQARDYTIGAYLTFAGAEAKASSVETQAALGAAQTGLKATGY